MLTAIRDRATGWIAWAIVILITIPFALWGINSYFEGGVEVSVASVDGVEISAYEYQRQRASQRQRMINRMGERFDPSLVDTPEMRQEVVDRLVENQLLSNYVQDRNFRISDAELMSLIREIPDFQEEGEFSESLYHRLLAANRFAPRDFERLQRTGGAIGQLESGLRESAFVTQPELDDLLLVVGEKRKTDYALIKADRYIDEIEVEEAEIEEYYAANQASFENPPGIRVDYIELSVESLTETVSPTEEDLEAQFEETKARYKTAESRRASHVLIETDDSLDDEERQARREQAEEIAQRARDGEDFAELATEYSDDAGSAANGGDLGVIAPGQMVKPFEDAVFSMQEGDISDPVESRFGFHVINLTQVDEERQQTLDEVRDEVDQEVRQIQAEELFAELAESFRNLVFESPEDLQASADELGLPLQTSDWFSENEGEGVARDYQVRQAAFSEDVLNEDLVSQAIEIGFDKLVAVQKNEYRDAHAKPLDEVREEIDSTIRLEWSRDRVLEFGADLLARLEEQAPLMEDWQAFVDAEELETETLAESRRDIPFNLADLGDEVFRLEAPAEGEIRMGGLSLGNGDYALYALQEVIPGDLETVDEAEKEPLRQQLLARDGSQIYRQFRSALKEAAEVVVHEDQL